MGKVRVILQSEKLRRQKKSPTVTVIEIEVETYDDQFIVNEIRRALNGIDFYGKRVV